MKLAYGLEFAALYGRDGLARVDAAFLGELGTGDGALAQRLVDARAATTAGSPLPYKEEAGLLLAVAPHVDVFIGTLFGIAEAIADCRQLHASLEPLYKVKWKFVKRQAMLKVSPESLAEFDSDDARAHIERWLGGPFEELAFARAVLAWQALEKAGPAPETARPDAGTHAATDVGADLSGAIDADEAARRLDVALHYSAWAAMTEQGQRRHAGGVLFRQPGRVDPYALLHHVHAGDEDGAQVFRIDASRLRRRSGFALTDPGTDLRGALDETNYCIWCHNQGKDSCSKGLRDKPGPDGHPVYKRSAFGVKLAGCPLSERISEFQLLKTQGHAIGALAMITIENPMVAGTGHRICNDCMKSCIYQKQDPVDIPQAETRTLKDVLELPWGFEVYSLLTRWNPLNLRRWLPMPESGYKVLVAGMGPAGFTLAHHLLNDGHEVVGIDGLKIEPLDARLTGVRHDAPGGAQRVPFEPIEDVATLWEPLDRRVMAGFGGVAEYGITVRWDKNFLKVIRLLLERRDRFAMAGGVRFGGTLEVDDAFALGFDHVALAMGAGRPTVLEIPNGLARGVRTASDFLMALQLTGAAREDSIANMQVRLPVVVIGGGLTAIDTATEALAYYVVQVEKFLARHEALAASLGEPAVRAAWSAEDREIGEEFLTHARALRAERALADREGRPARLVELVQQWGGVRIAYRKRLIDSPSYTLNHEEIEYALEEGIGFAECLDPRSIEVDEYGAVRSIELARQARRDDGSFHDDGITRWAARTVFVAAGTQPNTVLAREDRVHFALDGKYFQAIDEAGAPVRPERATSKPAQPQVLLSRIGDGRMMSYFGDLHPSYFGNVVKAMGSALQAYSAVSRVLRRHAPARPVAFAEFEREIGALLRPTVHRVERLTPTIVEVVLHAPMQARKFRPGQFFRLQNFEAHAPAADCDGLATRLAMEGLALTGAWTDPQAGLVSTIVLEMGGSSDLCAILRPGEPVVLMGPTGTATEVQGGETVALAGGGLGNAVLFSIGAAMRAAGSRVVYFAGYKKLADRYKVAEIEAAADVVVWCCDEAPGFTPTRPQDRSVVGNIVQAMLAYASGELEPIAEHPRLAAIDRLIAIGSDKMMAAVARARHGVLAPYLNARHFAIGSINSPMQCMMKEICAQCLQPQRDPLTGETRYVFSCFNQDQPLDAVDFAALDSRLRQNALQEKLTARWLGRCLSALAPAAPAPSS